MKLYTIGFTKKTAEEFFGLLRANGVRQILDVRLNNASQLAGFTKSGDLEYFLKEICGASYKTLKEFAPTKALLDGYRDKALDWQAYEREYAELMDTRKAAGELDGALKLDLDGACLLCSEEKPEKCHRRLAAEYLRRHRQCDNIEIIHL